MFKKLFLTFFLIFVSFVIIYPSRKENVNILAYCHSFEKIFYRNSVEKNKNVSKNFKTFAKDITLLGIKKTSGVLAYEIIDQYKTSKKNFFITIVPNQFYCLAGYWIEELNPGTFKSILLEKSKEKIYKYKDIKKDLDEFIKDIHIEYESIKIRDLF